MTGVKKWLTEKLISVCAVSDDQPVCFPASAFGARRAGSASQAMPLRSGAQAAMLAALGTFSTMLTLIYMLANRPPLVLLLTAPLWSLWLLSFVDWLRGERTA